MEDFQCSIKEPLDITKLDIHDFYNWPLFYLNLIKKVIGKPYKYNCFDETGFDCYTLIYYFYTNLGINLPKENIATYNLKQHSKIIEKNLILFNKVNFSDRQPFDIIIFNDGGSFDTHLGLILDINNFIHTTKQKPVLIEPINNNIESSDIRKLYRWNFMK